jgi:2,3-bisphosphoglycerate-independent phosphoglycerate mutase
MDRDNRWERIEKAYSAMVDGEGNTAATAVEAVDTSYANDVSDEFIVPTVINPNEEQKIKKGDSIICFDFRPDRVRQITRALTVEDFSEFERKAGYLNPFMVTFTMYDKTLTNVKDIAFKKEMLKNTLGEYLCKENKKQLRIAETEKYAHVTYFFNGGIEKQYEGEDRALIASPKVATYDLQPEMSAEEVTDTLLQKMEETEYDVIILNYANCDMVGHTAIFPAVVKAVETVDACSKRIIEAVLAKGGEVIVTADHGNAEKLVDAETHEAFTAHTTNPVPCILVTNDKTVKGIREGGRLSDLAPTMLDRLGMEIPEEMTGKTLIKQ